ncbi:MAG: SRPBCC family protein [Cyanobacteria bacterium J06638_6]
MSTHQRFEQSIFIEADVADVERCITHRDLMHRWLNPALRCEPIGDWSTALGAKSRFTIQIPLWQPALFSTVIEREPGLVVWAFEGFFNGQDRWECRPELAGTQLFNRFEFEIPNPIVATGFNWLAAPWTKRDMVAQLNRLKQVAETEAN